MDEAVGAGEKEEVMVSWDDICVNPHEPFLEQGRQEGREAGLASGYKDGYALGRSKAVELGVELGFICGFINIVSASNELKRNERIDKHLQELSRAIQEFPSPDEMFASNTDRSRSETNSSTGEDLSLDVLNKMQRIRAKFKLITVQLGMPRFSLKQVMKDAAAQTTEDDRGKPTRTPHGLAIPRKNGDRKPTDASSVSAVGVSSDW